MSKLRTVGSLGALLLFMAPPALWFLACTGHLTTESPIARKNLKPEGEILRSTKQAFSPPLDSWDERHCRILYNGRSLGQKPSIVELHATEEEGGFWVRGAYVRIKPPADAGSEGADGARYTIKRPMRFGSAFFYTWLAACVVVIVVFWRMNMLRAFIADCARGWQWITDTTSTVPRSPWLAVSYATVATALLAVAHLEKLKSPFLVAEDGPVFLQQNLEHGVAAIFMPYAGYLLVLPRILAFLCGFGPLEEQARLQSLMCLAVMWVVFFSIARCSASLKESLVLAAFLVIGPFNGYLMLSLTNLQWFTGLALVLLATSPHREPSSRWAGGWLLAGTFLIALTGPFCVIALPVFLWNAWRSRSRFSILMALLQGVGAAIQFYCLFSKGQSVTAPVMQERTSLVDWLTSFVPGLFGQVFDDATVGQMVVSTLLTVFVGMIIAGTLWAWRNSPEGRTRLIALLGVAGLFAAAGWTRSSGIMVPWNHGERYYIIPYALMLVIVTAAFYASSRVLRVSAAVFLFASLAGLAALPPHLVSSPDWKAAVRRIPPGGQKFVATYPPGETWAVFVAKDETGKTLRGQEYGERLARAKERASAD